MGAIIPIADMLNLAEEVAELFTLMLDDVNLEILPPLTIPQIQAGRIRPGLNSAIITSSMVARFPKLGIPSGPLANGTPNVMVAYTEALIEEIVSAIQDDMRVEVAVDPGILLQAYGANAGGPVVAIGATSSPHLGIGIAR